MPFFVRPIAKALCSAVQQRLIDPNLHTALAFMDQHLAQHAWFAGDEISLSDFQMSFAVEAALARHDPQAGKHPNLEAYLARLHARRAYQQALDKGGPVIMPA